MSKPPENNKFLTINIEDAQALAAFNGDDNQNMNNNNEGLPEDFKLQPFETDDDDFLLDYLCKNPLQDETEKNVMKNTTTMNNNVTTSMPIVPKMYFPQSNVTINYHFHK